MQPAMRVRRCKKIVHPLSASKEFASCSIAFAVCIQSQAVTVIAAANLNHNTDKIRGAPKNWHHFCTPYNFTKYQPIPEFLLLLKSRENL